MPRPVVNLDQYKELIGQLYVLEEQSLRAIHAELTQKYGVVIAKRTLQRRLKDWSMEKYAKTEDTPELRLRIVVLFYDTGLDNVSIAQVLTSEGFQIGIWALMRIRKKLGMICRLSPFQLQEQDERVQHLVETELDKGTILPYGRGLLHQYFKMQGHIISR